MIFLGAQHLHSIAVITKQTYNFDTSAYDVLTTIPEDFSMLPLIHILKRCYQS